MSGRAVERLAQYRLPREKVVVAMQEHWASKAEPIATAIVGFFLVITIGSVAPVRMGVLANAAWWLWFVLVLRAAWIVLKWQFSWFVATDKRLLLLYGIVTRKVAMMPMARVTDMSYTRSPLGRILGYGTFVLESAGQDQALSKISYVRRPDETYRLICDQIFAGFNPAKDGPSAASRSKSGGAEDDPPPDGPAGPNGPAGGLDGAGGPDEGPTANPLDRPRSLDPQDPTEDPDDLEMTDVPIHRLGRYLEPREKSRRTWWRLGEPRVERRIVRRVRSGSPEDEPEDEPDDEPDEELGAEPGDDTDQSWAVSREDASPHHPVRSRPPR
ncbi:PH domain-containing protein [Luteipulveratus flavus]|uniref:PH domain-containing protein n=1 Tax=Luteipulveratus flavus TaxID=3031728 RepID=A0ABT6CBS4_9MICO|nr:PH domain-containing protein [Luteipulveratus sp. YIM 133296]MDF8266339.1 PH domain-containing protein [Luteipulveratus sp. YIM 133296]